MKPRESGRIAGIAGPGRQTQGRESKVNTGRWLLLSGVVAVALSVSGCATNMLIEETIGYPMGDPETDRL